MFANLPAEIFTPAFSQQLLHLSLSGIMLLRPLYTPDGHAIRDFAWEYLNPAAQRMLGLPARPAESFCACFPSAELAGVLGFYRDAFRSGQPQHRQNNYQHDGLDGYYLLAAQRAGDLLLVSFTDTNDHPRSATEQELRQSQTREQTARAEAETQRQRLEQLFMQAPAAICILGGPELVYELVNPAYQQLFPGRRLQGYPLLEALPELADQPVWHTLQQVYRTGQPHLELGIRIPVARTEGGPLEDFYFNYVQQARRDAHGRIDGVVVFAFTVTEQVRAREQVQQLNHELQQSNTRLLRTNADLDAFVYTASHDLKLPIANLEGLLMALRDALPAEAQQTSLVAELLRRLDLTVERLYATITQLTDLVRLQQAQEVAAAPVALAPVLQEVAADLSSAVEATGATLHVEVPAGLQVVFAPAHVRSVLYNLLSNALKYHDPQRPAQVWVRAEQQPGAVVVSVRDNGLGLTATQQARLFQVFQRFHTHVGGTGVGLYMIKRLLENGGGSIAVRSKPGEGSTFTVTFAS